MRSGEIKPDQDLLKLKIKFLKTPLLEGIGFEAIPLTSSPLLNFFYERLERIPAKK